MVEVGGGGEGPVLVTHLGGGMCVCVSCIGDLH